MNVATAPTRQRRKEARPQELLDAAIELFAQKGFAATRSDEVATRAGVSKGTLYLYYPSKEELFKAVVRNKLSALIAEGEELAAGFSGSTSDLLEQLMITWWERVGATDASSIHKIILSEVRNFPEIAQFYSDEVIVPADRLFSGAIRRGIQRGEFRALPEHEAAHALMAPMIFLAMHRHSIGACPVKGGEIDPLAMLRTHLDLVLRGLEVREPARSLNTAAPIEPVKAAAPTEPVNVAAPAGPMNAAAPARPVNAPAPARPVNAAAPARPVNAAAPAAPARPARPARPSATHKGGRR